MKKIFLAIALIATVGLLAGCQSESNSNFDDADNATFDDAGTEEVTDVGEPPVPPEPVEAQ